MSHLKHVRKSRVILKGVNADSLFFKASFKINQQIILLNINFINIFQSQGHENQTTNLIESLTFTQTFSPEDS